MWKKLPLKNYIYASTALNLLSLSAIFALKSYLPPVLPLFYGLPAGPDQLAPTLALAIVPSLSLVITGINIILSNLTKDPFFKKSLVLSSAFVSVLTTIATIKIILLIGFF